MTTPLLGMRVNVKFTGIGINDKLVMTSGEVVALSEPMNEWIKDQNDYFAAWDKYKGKIKDLDIYEKRYEILTKNRMKGKIAEEEFEKLMSGYKPDFGIDVGDSKRFFDNVLDGVAREVKSGPVSLSAYKNQILKDLDIIEFRLAESSLGISKIEWHCFEGIDKEVQEFVNNELMRRNLSTDKFIFKSY